MKKMLLIGLAALILSTWLLAKHHHFARLDYISDMFSFLQMSVSWLDGRPLLYENGYGFHDRIHNFYIVLLFSPLVYVAGANGLFIGHAVLLLAALVLLILKTDFNAKPLAVNVAFFLLLLGPVSFWIWDNPVYGWHAELLYFPLCLLFTVAFVARMKWVSIGSVLAILLVKEDAPVLLCCLFLFFHLFGAVSKQGSKGVFDLKGLLNRRTFEIIGFWIVVFLAGMLFISVKNSFSESRLPMALGKLATNAGSREFAVYFAKLILANFGLGLPPVLFLLWVCRLYRINYRLTAAVLLVLLLCSLPLFLVNIVQGAFYYPATFMSVGWPPRFSLTWSFLLSALLFVYHYTGAYQRPAQPGRNAFPQWFGAGAAALLVLLLQVAFLYRVREYNWLERYLYAVVPVSLADGKPVTPGENLQRVYCLSEHLPRATNVRCPNQLFGVFHKNYLVWEAWPQLAWKKPEVIVVEKGKDAPDFAGYVWIEDGAYRIAVLPSLKQNLDTCPNAH